MTARKAAAPRVARWQAPLHLVRELQAVLEHEPEDWRTSAACATGDPDLFFRDETVYIDQARAVCRRCPVRDDCLAYILAAERTIPASERYGVFAALTAAERNILQREAAA